MTGLDLLEWVREGNPTIPFIIFTGRSQEIVAIRALNLGADYYLKKGTDEIQDLFGDIAHRIVTEVESRRTTRLVNVKKLKMRLFYNVSLAILFVEQKI